MSPDASPILANRARLLAVHEAARPRRYPAAPYDHVTRVIANVLKAPVALVSLVDECRQFFLGAAGLPGALDATRETPLSQSLCQYVVTDGETLRIVDGRVDPRVRDNGAVRELGVVGYIGVPLRLSGGAILGSLCAITFEPREWSAGDEAILRDLAVLVLSDLELRAELAQRDDQSRDAHRALSAEGLPDRSVDILDSITDGVVALDRGWRITFVNRRAVRLLRTPRRQAVGAVLWELFPTLSGSEVEQVLRDAATSGDVVHRELHWPEADRWFDIRAVPMRQGLSLYFDDITDLLRAREEAAAHEEERRQAQQMKLVSALAGGIAHDFNNMLTVVRANCEMLIDVAVRTGEVPVELREIRAAAVRGSALTQQLVAFSRKQVVQPRVIDVNAAVQALVPMLLRLIAAQVQVEAQFDDTALHVLADPAQFEQAVTNLALNARDAMPDGGTIRLATAAVTIDTVISTSMGDLAPGEWVRVSVTDSGEGIDANVLPRIFEPFFTTKAVGVGVGLGLATVCAIAQQQGGVVTVESAAAVGTTFHLYLPAFAARPPAGVATDGVPAAVGGECILVVEDERAVRRAVERLLRSSGYTLLQAEDGAEALEIMERHGEHVSLVLSDVLMPNMGGMALVEHLREQYPQVPVMLMSAFGETDSVQKQLARAEVSFVQKPFTGQQLLMQVREAIDGRPIAAA